MAKHQKKLRFICTAVNQLTTYNPEWNEKVHNHCTAEELFEPEVSCAIGQYGKCKYLKVKTYT